MPALNRNPTTRPCLALLPRQLLQLTLTVVPLLAMLGFIFWEVSAAANEQIGIPSMDLADSRHTHHIMRTSQPYVPGMQASAMPSNIANAVAKQADGHDPLPLAPSFARIQRPAHLLHASGIGALIATLQTSWHLLLVPDHVFDNELRQLLEPRRIFETELRQHTLLVFVMLALASVLMVAWLQMRRHRNRNRKTYRSALRSSKTKNEANLSKREHSRLREQLRAMARRLMTVQEDERRMLSRELHDDIGQAITAIRLGAMSVQDDDDAARRTEVLDEIITITDQTVAKVRNLSLLLRPPQLDSLGLVAALRWQADMLFRSAGQPHLELALAALPQRPDTEVELACFRIAQEALTNILRHSGAKQVILTLEVHDGLLQLTVSDDGHGFDPSHGDGLGLVTMRERAQQLDGTLEVHTSASHGTRVRATLPMRR